MKTGNAKFALWMKEHGEGCDYTVSCGEKLHILDSTDPNTLFDEIKRVVIYDYGFERGSERSLREAKIVKILHDINVDALFEEHEQEEEEERELLEKEQRYRQYLALKEEFE